jgi:hypothetical protein
MPSIKDSLTEEQIIELLRKVGGAAKPKKRGGEYIDAEAGPLQMTQEVSDDNEIVDYVGGVEKNRTKMAAPDYSIKDLHPEKFIEEADRAIETGGDAKEKHDELVRKVEALTMAADPEKLLERALESGEEPVEPAKTLDTLVDNVLCSHPGCDASFKTEKQLTAHKRAMAHAEYAEGKEKWEKSIPYARLKKKEAKSDESGDTEPDTKASE